MDEINKNTSNVGTFNDILLPYIHIFFNQILKLKSFVQ